MTSTAADGSSSLALPVLDADLEARLRARMDEVEERLEREIRSEAPFVTEAARHLMHAGGKRFRPLLVLLAAETGDPTGDGVVTAACVVELTHLASLYHDDVMDEADLRRGAESANARWDNHVAILTGDFLFSKSSELTASLGADAVRIQARDVHQARRGPDPRDAHARPRRGRARALPAGRRGQDRLADRDLGPLRRPVRRCPAGGRGGAHGVRREGRHRLPALRRHPRRRLASPTSPARRPAPTCARACRPCRC